MERRNFISLFLASSAAIMSGCQKPDVRIVPQTNVETFHNYTQKLIYATTYSNRGCRVPIRVITADGRPIRIEPGKNIINTSYYESIETKHAIDALTQSQIYNLYHPDRFFKPIANGKESNLNDALLAVKELISDGMGQGKDIVFILNDDTDQLVIDILEIYKSKNPKVHYILDSMVSNNHVFLNKRIFGLNGDIIYNLKKQKRIVSVNSDFLGAAKHSLNYKTQLTQFDSFPEIITFELGYTITGAISDTRFAVNNTQLDSLLALICLKLIDKNRKEKLSLLGGDISNIKSKKSQKNLSSNNSFEYIDDSIYDLLRVVASVYIFDNSLIDNMINDIEATVFLPCDLLSSFQYSLTILINQLLGIYQNADNFHFNKHIDINSNDSNNLSELINSSIIIYLNTDSYYHNNLGILRNASKNNKISLSDFKDITSQNCIINIPSTNFLESWGYYNSSGKTLLRQPVIEKLNSDSISEAQFLIELKELFTSEIQFSNEYDLINNILFNNNEKLIRESLKKGFKVNEDIIEKEELVINFDGLLRGLFETKNNKDSKSKQVFTAASPILGLGKDANNPWILELPDPITGQSWGNGLMMNSKYANSLGVCSADIVKFKLGQEIAEAPVIIMDEIADDVIMTYSGFGRKVDGDFSAIAGFNARSYIDIASITKTGRKAEINPIGSLKNSISHSNQTRKSFNNPAKLQSSEYKWSMAIDISNCIGCNSCMIACQVENNIPFVGAEEIRKSRNLFWVEIIKHTVNKSGHTEFVPLMCLHCDNAPCESVCPVYASTHHSEGINETTYNRCVGSRFCMVNCPYEVRKFNYFEYSKNYKAPVNLALNPDVSARTRGIVEKCSLCIHRINQYKRDKALKLDSESKLDTACAVACPTNAITFGNLLDPDSKIAKLIATHKRFDILEELNTQPSIFYFRSKIKKNS